MSAALETMRCDDVQRLVHAYLDGELLEADRIGFDEHVGACAACRGIVDEEARFKATLRARLRPVPAAPAELRARVLAALDEADSRTGQGPTPPLLRRAMPFVAVFAAAASMVVFLSTVVQPRVGRAAIVEDCIRSHEKNLPVEIDTTASSCPVAGPEPCCRSSSRSSWPASPPGAAASPSSTASPSRRRSRSRRRRAA